MVVPAIRGKGPAVSGEAPNADPQGWDYCPHNPVPRFRVGAGLTATRLRTGLVPVHRRGRNVHQQGSAVNVSKLKLLSAGVWRWRRRRVMGALAVGGGVASRADLPVTRPRDHDAVTIGETVTETTRWSHRTDGVRAACHVHHTVWSPGRH